MGNRVRPLLGPVDIASPPTYPAWVDAIGGIAIAGMMLSLVTLLMGLRVGLIFSAIAVGAGLIIGLFDYDYAPVAGRWELAVFAAMGLVTAVAWFNSGPRASSHESGALHSQG